MQMGEKMKLFSKKKVDVMENAPDEIKETIVDDQEDIMAVIKKRNPKNKKKIIRIIVIAVLIVGIGGGAIYVKAAGNSGGLQLQTTEVTKGDIEQTISTSGTVQSENVKTYFADVAAPVAKVDLEVGTTIEAGQKLLTYDTVDLELAKQEADLTASATKKKLAAQLEESNQNEIKFATSNVGVGTYDSQIADLEAKIDNVYCMINSNDKWKSDEGTKLESEISDLKAEMSSISGNSAEEKKRKDKLEDRIDERYDEINSHDNTDLNEYLRQGKEQLSKLEEYKSEQKSTKQSSETAILSGTEKSEISDNTKLTGIAVETANNNLEKASKGITAEFGGIVSDVKVIEGSMTAMGSELFTIADCKNVKVVMSVSKFDLEYLQVGQKTDITVAGHPYTGSIKKIDRMAKKNESGSAVVTAEIHVDNPDDFIYLGVDAKVIIHIANATDAMMLPVEAVNTDKSGYYCYVIANGIIERRELTLGISSDSYTEILGGLNTGDQVITDTAMDLESLLGTKATSISSEMTGEESLSDNESVSDNEKAVSENTSEGE